MGHINRSRPPCIRSRGKLAPRGAFPRRQEARPGPRNQLHSGRAHSRLARDERASPLAPGAASAGDDEEQQRTRRAPRALPSAPIRRSRQQANYRPRRPWSGAFVETPEARSKRLGAGDRSQARPARGFRLVRSHVVSWTEAPPQAPDAQLRLGEAHRGAEPDHPGPDHHHVVDSTRRGPCPNQARRPAPPAAGAPPARTSGALRKRRPGRPSTATR